MARGDNDFPNEIADRLVALGPVRARRMFGGHGIFLEGTMFGLIVRDTLYFKVGENNRKDYETAGSKPFSYVRGTRRVSLSYMAVPEPALNDGAALTRWGERAYAAARAGKTKSRKRR
jgi:DNA transformation protein